MVYKNIKKYLFYYLFSFQSESFKFHFKQSLFSNQLISFVFERCNQINFIWCCCSSFNTIKSILCILKSQPTSSLNNGIFSSLGFCSCVIFSSLSSLVGSILCTLCSFISSIFCSLGSSLSSLISSVLCSLSSFFSSVLCGLCGFVCSVYSSIFSLISN